MIYICTLYIYTYYISKNSHRDKQHVELVKVLIHTNLVPGGGDIGHGLLPRPSKNNKNVLKLKLCAEIYYRPETCWGGGGKNFLLE